MYSSIIFLLISNAFVFGDINICKSDNYRANTLKCLRDQPVDYSFVDTSTYSGPRSNATVPNRFEASDIVIRPDGRYAYVVFDSTYQIGAFCTPSAIQKNNCIDKLLDWPDAPVDEFDSEFEGIVYNPLRETYHIVREAIPTKENPEIFKPIIIEIRITDTNSPIVKVVESCQANFSFTTDSKGFEGLEFVTHQQTGKSYLLALCEANLCASINVPVREDNNLGNGRLVVLEKKAATSSQPCQWNPIDFINLPSSVTFLDYSSVSIFRRNPSDKLPSYIAVITQEDSQVFIGIIEEITQTPYFKISTLPKNTIYDLPRGIQSKEECLVQYCNIEGVTWRGKNQLIMVSDQTKAIQGAACIEKDQSLHYFVLPEQLTD